MKRFWTRCATLVFVFLIGTASLYADAIPTVYSTGVDDNGTPLSDLSQDMHYQIISAPDGAGTTANSYVVDSTKFPLASAWMENDGTSKWIAPQADQSTFLNETSSGFYT